MNAITSRVCVVIPAYRAANTIGRALHSVLQQTYPVTEIIVIDDGSPDDQVERIQQEFGDQVILVRQPNSGVAKARNAGLARSTAEWITFLDADDYWEPTKIERQLAIFAKHPELGIVAGRFWSEVPGEERTPWQGPSRCDAYYDRVLKPNGPQSFHVATMVWTGMVMMRRSAWANRPFNSRFEPAEDRDLWIRIAAEHPVYLSREALATAVLLPGSLSRSSIDRDCLRMLDVVEQHAPLLGPFATRQWRSHTYARWGGNDPQILSSLRRLAYSLFLWPLPFSRIASRRPWGRLRRLLVLARHALAGKSTLRE